MTADEKRMKRYVNAVERRLNLPREIKARVMNDFTSSISARRESGMTDEEIYAEFGDAKKAAADLNEQLKAFTYRKSPWRFVFLLAAILGGGKMLSNLLAQLILLLWGIANQSSAASIGIIGGADGPTAIFITSRPDPIPEIFWVFVFLAGTLGFFRLRRYK